MSEFDLGALGVGEEERQLLHRFGFAAETFMHLRQKLRGGAFPISRNIVTKPVTPPRPEDLAYLPAAHSREALELEARGRTAIARGELGLVILNGGMATRFGGAVKGVVEVFDGRSFLELKLEDAARAAGQVPVFLMCSFATEADTRAYLKSTDAGGDRVHTFTQGISIRLTPDAEIFRDAQGRVSLYAPGHGDLFESLAHDPGLRRFVAAGGKHLLVSNVDNLGATLSPRIVGAHLHGGRAVTVEVAERAATDVGGAPARVGGHLEVLEGFRFPPDFDIARLPVFNTNTLLVDIAAVRPDYELSWFRADKTVDGRPAVQFERLMGEVTAFVDAIYLVVPRDGPEGRFLPVKTPADLERLRPALRARTGH
jgi:UTP--glucose-1-phosphate uridylyltransferase